MGAALIGYHFLTGAALIGYRFLTGAALGWNDLRIKLAVASFFFL